MLSYPVMTGNKNVDERVYAHLNDVAVSQNLSEAETQRCVITFARRMLHSLSERKSAGKSMDGAEFVEWLEMSAQNHPAQFRSSYHPVTSGPNGSSTDVGREIACSISSKQNEIGFGERNELMLSDFDGVLASAACQLTPSSRLIVLWHYFGGISARDLAKHFGLRESDIRKRIVLAAAEMQTVLSRDGYARLKPEGYQLTSNQPARESRRAFAH